MPSPLQIIVNTPLWVWPLLAVVVFLGLRDFRTRVVTPPRLGILPLVGLVVSMTGLVQSTSPALAVGVWAVALLAALPLGYAIGRRRTVRPLPDGRLEIAGGLFSLLFGLSIFVVRYALGVLFGVLPALRFEPLWIVVSSGIGGLIAGIGIGWLVGLTLRVRRSTAVVR